MTAAALIPLVAGLAIQGVNEKVADNKRKRIISSMLTDQGKRKGKVADETLKEAENYAAEKRAPQLEQQEQLAQADYGKALTASDIASTPESRQGKVSASFKPALDTALAGSNDRAKRLTALLSKVRAPGSLRQVEAERRGGVTEQVGSDLQDAKFAAEAGGMDAAQVRPNPWVQLLGQGLQAYGTYTGATAATNAERLKTIQAMMAARGATAPAGPYAGFN